MSSSQRSVRESKDKRACLLVSGVNTVAISQRRGFEYVSQEEFNDDVLVSTRALIGSK